MAYLTVTQLKNYISENQLIQLSSDADPPVAIDTTVVEALLDAASETIDDFLRQAYSDLPFTTPSASIKRFCAAITIFELYNRRTDPTEGVKNRYDDVISLLKLMGTRRSIEAAQGLESKPGVVAYESEDEAKLTEEMIG